MDHAKHIGIWIRVSTEDQVRGESPETHHKRATAYAEAKGWHIVDTYRLEAISGKSVMGHPEAQRMLDDIKRGRITGLVFSKLARLARNTRELLEIAEVFRDQGADLISLQESIDTSSPAGRLFFTMIAAMAQWEREEIAERVAASVPIRAKMGKPIGGAAPFGYRWQDKKLVPHPDEAPVRKLLHELFREHGRKKTVARILNDQGYRTRNGSQFSDTTVARLIVDPTAKGLHRANYTKTSDRSKNWTLKPETDWVYTNVPAIMDAALWDECAAILTSQRAKRKPPSKKVTHLFSGLTFCHCGTKMYVPSDSPKHVCQKCRNKIPLDDLEAIFHEQLHGFMFSETEIAKYLADHNTRLHEQETALGTLRREHTRVQDESDKLYHAYIEGALDIPNYTRLNEPLLIRLRSLEDEMPKAEAALDLMKVGFQSQEYIIQEARDLHTRWPELAQSEKREIVEAIVERITVHADEVEIDLYFEPEPNTLRTGGGGGGSAPTSSILLTDSEMATRACRCGHLCDAALACSRAPRCAADYQAKISGPLLDRIDLHVEVQAVSAADLVLPPPAEGSAEVAARVAAARNIQSERLRETSARTNAELDGDALKEHATPDEPGQKLLAQAAEAMKLSARGYTRILRVARTIADLAGAENIGRIHIAEALSYRRIVPRN